jgi:predicted TPR repeat methyltransferase
MKARTVDSIGDVRFLMKAYVPSAALNAALELGLFWQLADEPRDAAGVAEMLGIPTNRCGYWLDLLSSEGLLDEVAEGYVPSSAAQTAILDSYSRETWALLAREAREHGPAVHDLARLIHEPRAGWDALGLTHPDYVDRMRESPQRARQFTRMLSELHRSLADELAETLDLNDVERLMDLGGGSGVISMGLLRRYPDLSSVVVDIPNVCAAGREIAEENAMEERLTYHAANFLKDELPSGFDMVLECDVGVYQEALFRKVHKSLNPGGRFVIVEDRVQEEGVVPSNYLPSAFLDSLEDSDFALPSVEGIEALLASAGFEQISKGRVSGDYVVIDAHKER